MWLFCTYVTHQEGWYKPLFVSIPKEVGLLYLGFKIPGLLDGSKKSHIDLHEAYLLVLGLQIKVCSYHSSVKGGCGHWTVPIYSHFIDTLEIS